MNPVRCASFLIILLVLALSRGAAGQQTPAAPTSAAAQLPRLVKFSGTLKDGNGNPLAGVVGVTFALYSEQSGGDPLWLETQDVQADENGHYAVMLGATRPDGVPVELFASEQAHWLGVQPEGQPQQSRVMLVSVPYALKAVDAETLAGRAAGDYITREDLQSAVAPIVQTAPPNSQTSSTITGTGTSGTLPVWTGASTLGNSVISESGTKVGIGTTSPATEIDVNGAATLRGAVNLPSTGASSKIGVSSPVLVLGASSFSKPDGLAVAQNFAWQAVSAGNNTASPTANLHLLFGKGIEAPAATGLSIAPTGLIDFAAGQKFPGTGTITGVKAASPLTGGGDTGVAILGLSIPALEATLNPVYARLGAENTFTAPITFTSGQTFPGTGPGTITGVTAGTGLKGGGTSASVTLSVDPALVPMLSASNVFTGAANAFSNPITFAGAQSFPGTLASVTANSPITQTTTAGVVSVGLNASALETTLNGVYPQLSAANTFKGTSNTFTNPVTFSSPVTFASGQTFPGTVTGVAATSPITQSVTDGAVTVGLNTSALQTTLNGVYAQLNAANTFTKPVSFASGQTFPGAVTSIGVGTGILLSGTAGAPVLAIDSTVVPQLSGAAFTGAVSAETSNVLAGALSGAGTSGSAGVDGNSDTGNGVLGYSQSPSSGGAGVFGRTGEYSSESYQVAVDDGFTAGVWGDSPGSPAILGYAAGVVGTGNLNYGGYFLSVEGTGALGMSHLLSAEEAGVQGVGNGNSKTFAQDIGSGVWGDNSTASTSSLWNVGVTGTADNSQAGIFLNDSADWPTVFAYNSDTGVTSTLFKTFLAASKDGICGIGSGGSLTCTGQVKTLATTGGGTRKVETYAIQSPENWMEDFGSGLLQRGVAVVEIDPAYAETIAADASYHVFITPNADSKGLYVIRKTATSFEVRESGGGVSSLSFDYRIVAKRRGYETQRLIDVTERFNTEQAKSIPPKVAAESRAPRPQVQMHPALGTQAVPGSSRVHLKPLGPQNVEGPSQEPATQP